MNLLNKLSVFMAKIGCAGLRNASEKNKDNLEYVKAVVKAQGPRSFQFASDYIREDAVSILKMVKVNSAILKYTKDKIIDRYVDYVTIVEEEVDYFLFVFKCLEIDVNSLLYFNKELQDKVIDVLNTEDFVIGKFAGKDCVVDIEDLKNQEDLINLVSYIQNKNNNID